MWLSIIYSFAKLIAYLNSDEVFEISLMRLGIVVMRFISFFLFSYFLRKDSKEARYLMAKGFGLLVFISLFENITVYLASLSLNTKDNTK